MANNRTFFKNVRAGRMSFRDIFSDVTKKHTPEENARVLIAGTPLTTPGEAEMLAGWQKPFMFSRFFLVAAVLCALGYGMFRYFGHMGGGFLFLAVMPMLVNVSLLILTWEMNIPRNISLYEILVVCAIGGMLSIIATLVFGQLDTSVGAQWAPLTEEPAKALIVYILLARKDRKYLLNGILLGMAVGTGFAVIETLYYNFLFTEIGGFSLGFYTAARRAALAISGHGIWAAMEGAGMMLAKGDEKLSPAHLFRPQFLVYFFGAFALHFLHNYDVTSLPGLEDASTIRYIAISAAAALTLLHLLKKGANQAVDISAAYNSGRVTLAVNRQETFRENAGSASVFLEGISGTVTGRVFPIQEGQVLTIGRLEGCDLCLPGQGNVSGRHCRIAMQAGQLTVTDLGSTNGTYVGGQRLAANVPVALRGGSTVYLGGQDCGLRVRT